HTRSKRDWSSDVCSSDLVISLARRRAYLSQARYLNRDSAEPAATITTATTLVRLKGMAARPNAPTLSTTTPPTIWPAITSAIVEIGRASCRERVEISEVG